VNGGPWERPGEQEASEPPRRRARPLAAVAIIVAAAGLIAALAHAYPDALRIGDDWAQLAFFTGFMVLLASGASRLTRGRLVRYAGHGAIWLGVAAVLALGFVYRAELAQAPQRLRLALSSGAPVATGEHEVAIPRGESGHYIVEARVNGAPVRFMVDTGASDTVLSPDDARRVGVDMAALDFGLSAETANGVGYGAPIRATLEVGPIDLADFPMTVNQAPMRRSLLGMSFLNRLQSFEVRGDTLILRWRDGG
jgi:aspartyl protease family protein